MKYKNILLGITATTFLLAAVGMVPATAQAAEPGDVIIKSAMPQPTEGSASGVEYLVLKNNAKKSLDLDGWRIHDEGSLELTISSSIASSTNVLKEGEYKICDNAATSSDDCDAVASNNTLSLNDTGDKLTITDASSTLISSAEYKESDVSEGESVEFSVGNTNTFEWFVTIQAAVNNASSGDVIVVKEGIYNGLTSAVNNGSAVNIDKSITLESANGKDNTTIAATSSAHWKTINVEASSVVIDGFTIENQGGIYGNNSNEAAKGVHVDGGSNIDGFALKNSTIENIKAPKTAAGISLYADQSGDSIANTTIENTEIKDVKTDNASDTKAKGISLNGDVTNTKISGNAIINLDSEKTRGIAITERNSSTGPTNFTVTGNTLKTINSSLNNGKILEGPATVFIGGYDSFGASSVMKENKFMDGIVRNMATSTLEAAHNYWGDSSGPSYQGPGDGTVVSTNVNFDPYYIDSGLTTLSNEVTSSGGGIAPSRSGGGSDDGDVEGVQDEGADGETDEVTEEVTEKDGELKGMVKGVQVSVDGNMTNEQISQTLDQVREQTLIIAEQLGMDVERLRASY